MGSFDEYRRQVLAVLDAAPVPLPRVLATPEGWVRLDEAGNPICEGQWQWNHALEAHQCLLCGYTGTAPTRHSRPGGWHGFPPLLYFMGSDGLYHINGDGRTRRISEPLNLETEDDIMSAVRAVARGS